MSFMSDPDSPPPTLRGGEYWGVIDQQPGPNGTVHVTFSLPGLMRCKLTVPESSWRNGEHLHAGPLLSQFVRQRLSDPSG